ncbi:MAG: type II toxin-antitoxin system RelE/ParE family toxin [Gammaproteobacteria bacterium]|nr:type II toxin-antitoxin system RelE/ParE family toxin [Gammaproteobacteria bacterium]
MPETPKRIELRFFRTLSGNEPVREWLLELPDDDRRRIGIDLATVEFGWPIGMPLCRAISSRRGLWEVRTDLSGRRIARVLFCVSDDRLHALHGFIKKTQKTPERDLDLAEKRMKELQRYE